MTLQVFLAQDLPKTINDSLQQIIWEFPISYIELVTADSVKLEPGSIFIDETGPRMIGLSGQNPLEFSWLKLMSHWASEGGGVKKSPILKALGAKRGEWVIDATCGTGRDSSYLLYNNIRVKAFERNPSIYFMLRLSQELEDFKRDDLILKFGKASDELKDKSRTDCKAIYFDPMFDDGSGRKAKPKKKMEVFHSIVGADKDALEEATLLRSLLGKELQRLVIKRSPRDGELLEKPNSTWQSKAVRFDLYL